MFYSLHSKRMIIFAAQMSNFSVIHMFLLLYNDLNYEYIVIIPAKSIYGDQKYIRK